MLIRTGDTVEVITGNDSGQKSRVIKVDRATGKAIVEGVNRVKKHERIRTTQRGSKTGGIVTQEAPIHISNVQIVDDQGNPTRIGYRTGDDGQKVRIARSTGKEL